ETQRPKNEDRGNHKKRAGHNAAPRFVKQPSDICGELLGLGPRKQHAVIERVEKALLAAPPLFLDQLGLHNRDLAGRPAKTDESEFQPEAERFRKGRVRNGWAVRP